MPPGNESSVAGITSSTTAKPHALSRTPHGGRSPCATAATAFPDAPGRSGTATHTTSNTSAPTTARRTTRTVSCCATVTITSSTRTDGESDCSTTPTSNSTDRTVAQNQRSPTDDRRRPSADRLVFNSQIFVATHRPGAAPAEDLEQQYPGVDDAARVQPPLRATTAPSSGISRSSRRSR